MIQVLFGTDLSTVAAGPTLDRPLRTCTHTHVAHIRTPTARTKLTRYELFRVAAVNSLGKGFA